VVQEQSSGGTANLLTGLDIDEIFTRTDMPQRGVGRFGVGHHA
jgi:hypothetical protein